MALPLFSTPLLPLKTNWRKTLFNLHLYAGLVVGLFLLTASLTGLVLAFRPKFDPAYRADYFHLAPLPARLPIDQVVLAARQVYPKAKLDYVEVDPNPASADLVRMGDRDEVFVDPYRGTVLKVRNKEYAFFYMVEKLHRYLFLGKQGQWLTGTAAFALFVMIGTGVYLWWPRTAKSLSTAFRFDRSLQSRAWNVNLHKVVGIYSAVLLAVSAFTGGAELPNWVAKVYFAPASSRGIGRALQSSGPVGGPGSVSAETVWRSAQAAMGPFQSAMFSWPKGPRGPMQVEYVAEDAPHPNALSYVFLDGYTGAVLRRSPYAQEAASSRFYLWLLPIHLGQIGGWAGWIAVVTGALGAAFLTVTGFWLYYRRKLRPVRRSAPTGRSESAALPGSAAGARARPQPVVRS